jgi:hypothetical protein
MLITKDCLNVGTLVVLIGFFGSCRGYLLESPLVQLCACLQWDPMKQNEDVLKVVLCSISILTKLKHFVKWA